MSETVPVEPRLSRGTVVVVITDVFFSVSIRSTLRRIGFDVELERAAERIAERVAVGDVRLVVVDATAISRSDDWARLGKVVADQTPVLVFGPHMDVDRLRAAKDAGVTRVVANSQFHREMAALVDRYALDASVGNEA